MSLTWTFLAVILFLLLAILTKKQKVNEVYDKIRDVDYTVISVADEINAEILAEIELLQGEFKGVRYTYGNVSNIQENEDETASLSFEFNITNNAGISDQILEESENFKNEIGEILVSIILASSKRQEELETMMAEESKNAEIVED